ncbi:MAG: protein kinase [Planctomycetes bacterium]|nr:protein kinase [Planctomycetota bacterium]
MNCEEVDARLLDLVEGDLPAEQANQVRTHLEECPACAAKYRETRQIVGDLGAARSIDEQEWDGDVRSAAPVSSSAPPVASTIGDFELQEEIGRGGMGVVFRARQISLSRVVALKVLSTGVIQSERAVTRFHKEAQAAARLHHTNIVPIYAQGHEAGHFYYAMELIEGKSLDQVLKDDPHFLRLEPAGEDSAESAAEATLTPVADAGRPAADHATVQPAPTGSSASLIRSSISMLMRRGAAVRTERRARDFKRIARLIAEVADGLNHAHEQNVVHRDIKPHNLLLGHDDKLHITDFGLARLLDEPGLTLSTELVGTPAYISPEQITAGGQAVDRRTDVFALGVTLYELLARQRPFQGETYDQIITRILKEEPKPPRRIDPHIPADLETICLRAIEKEPARRFRTCAEMARDLRRYADGFPIVSRRIGPLSKAGRWIRRHPARTAATASTIMVVALAPLLLWIARAQAEARLDRAYEILLADYRDGSAALAELGWLSRVLGDRDRRQMIEAFAHIRDAPKTTVRLVEETLGRRPDDPDAHYLLAWGYRRQMYEESSALWLRVRQHVEHGDALAAEPSAAGWFFRGQAVWGTDPKEAERTFDKAIAKRANFVQAMLHQARAMNQIMYFLRDRGYYQKAVSRLEFVTDAQPDKAYPRYLLSVTHLLAAEILASEGRAAESQQAYQRSLSAARDAQRVQPDSPRGYAAEANCLESQGDYRGALDAWNRIREPDVRMSRSDRSERDAYRMRLYFWLADAGNAKLMRAARYSALDGYVRDERYDADETLYEALLEAESGNTTLAMQILEVAVEWARPHAESLLRLEAGYRLLGQAPPAELWAGQVDYAAQLPPGWTTEWLKQLTRYLRGELAWPTLLKVVAHQAQRPENERLLLASAHFYRGVRELAEGRRGAAREAFAEAWQQHDNENYCFRARLVLGRMEGDVAWPQWLSEADAAGP